MKRPVTWSEVVGVAAVGWAVVVFLGFFVWSKDPGWTLVDAWAVLGAIVALGGLVIAWERRRVVQRPLPTIRRRASVGRRRRACVSAVRSFRSAWRRRMVRAARR